MEPNTDHRKLYDDLHTRGGLSCAAVPAQAKPAVRAFVAARVDGASDQRLRVLRGLVREVLKDPALGSALGGVSAPVGEGRDQLRAAGYAFVDLLLDLVQ